MQPRSQGQEGRSKICFIVVVLFAAWLIVLKLNRLFCPLPKLACTIEMKSDCLPNSKLDYESSIFSRRVSCCCEKEN